MERTTIADAAKRLDVTQEAIRARIRRGTIQHEKGEDGKTYVYLTDEQTHDQQRSNTQQQILDSVVNDYIEALKSQIEVITKDREEWKEEARRKDHIIMALTNRIPELEHSPEAAASPVTHTEDTTKGSVPPDAQKGSKRLSWWRKIFR